MWGHLISVVAALFCWCNMRLSAGLAKVVRESARRDRFSVGLGLPKSIDPHITERVRLPNHRPHLDSPQLLCGLSSSPTPLAAGLKAEMGGPVEWLRETRSVLSVTSRSLRRLPSKIQMKREKHGNNPQPTSKATPDLSRNRRTARPQKRAW